MPRIKDIYVIPPGSKAYSNSNISSISYNHLLEDLAFDNNSPRPISSGGTAATNTSQARINLGFDNASYLTKGTIAENLLPFHPVQQGGGDGQESNKIYLGWNGRQMLLQVDNSVMGEVWTSQLAPAALRDLISHANTADHIVYTNSSKQYAIAPLSSFMRNLLSCPNHAVLHTSIKTNFIKQTTVTNMERGPGYIHFDTNIGAVGCNYFISDERLKHIHGPSKCSALDVLDKLMFIEFNYIPDSGMDCSVRHFIGFSANNLQESNSTFVDQIGDYLSPNVTTIIPYLAKAIQELSQEIQGLRSIVDQLRSNIDQRMQS
ncbi:MAG: tail fiber domain-containing protein [Candidatus Liberibacter ctenarytainae]|uniref:Tail fiber domain-containing protein n=1 Tax=Candidatus Liberibacter ctenarytainae TaxID=2020335 RepID=A0A937DLZ5_9HYPH|nr:tail fiber domain-containing protein [Candidatus Liberibacter ctenarytainae]